MDCPTLPRGATPAAWAAGIALALPLAVIVTVDVLALRTPFAARLGLVSWGLLLAAIAGLAMADALDLTRSGLTGRQPLTLISTALVVAVLLSAVGDPRVVSQEGAIELRCASHWLGEDPRLGFWRTCLFGYPARQTYLHYLPTWLFGPSLAAMNVGGLLYLLIGIPVFAAELGKIGPAGRLADALVALAMLGLLHFFFVHETTLRPNMASFPLGVALLALGVYFRFGRSPSPANASLVVAVIVLAIHSYTPNLVVVAGAFALLLLYAIRSDAPPSRRGAAIGVVLLLALDLWRTFDYREDLRLLPAAIVPGGAGSVGALREALAYIAVGNGYFTAGAAVAAVAVIGYAAMFMRRALPMLLLGLIAAGLAAAALAHGYSFQGPWDRLHRANVVIPAALALFVLAGHDLLARIRRSQVRSAVAIALALLVPVAAWTGYRYRLDYLARKPPHPHEMLAERLGAIAPPLADGESTVVVVAPELRNEFESLNDLLRYRFPGAQSQVLPIGCAPGSMPRHGIGIAVFPADSACASAEPIAPICAEAFWRGDVVVERRRLEICAARRAVRTGAAGRQRVARLRRRGR